MEKNLEAQEEALEEQIAFLKMAKDMEEGKKNPDQDRLDELDEDIANAEENLEKLDEQREEFQRQMTETLGGTYDYAGVAESFLDAWLTAFEETGDGLSGLDDAFDDFFKNVLKKQVIYNGATAKIEPYLTKVNEALADGVLDDEELRQLEELGQKTKEDVSNYFDEANKVYGLADFGGDKLSALQAGIQGITEEQADVLAGYWNAVRSDVSAIRNVVQNYLSAEANIHENPLLPSLKTVATQTEAIFRLLNSAVGTNVSENDAINVRVVSML
jgi:predicted  nucleic acid-binding Zn-ribbon protein